MHHKSLVRRPSSHRIVLGTLTFRRLHPGSACAQILELAIEYLSLLNCASLKDFDQTLIVLRRAKLVLQRRVAGFVHHALGSMSSCPGARQLVLFKDPAEQSS